MRSECKRVKRSAANGTSVVVVIHAAYRKSPIGKRHGMRSWCAFAISKICDLNHRFGFCYKSFCVMKWVPKQALPGFECLAGCFAYIRTRLRQVTRPRRFNRNPSQSFPSDRHALSQFTVRGSPDFIGFSAGLPIESNGGNY